MLADDFDDNDDFLQEDGDIPSFISKDSGLESQAKKSTEHEESESNSTSRNTSQSQVTETELLENSNYFTPSPTKTKYKRPETSSSSNNASNSGSPIDKNGSQKSRSKESSESSQANSSSSPTRDHGPECDFDLENEEDELMLSQLDMEIDSIGISKPTPMDYTSNSTNSSAQTKQVQPNTSKYTFENISNTRRFTKRSFPGPAGLLPNLNPSEFSLLDKPVRSNPVSEQIERILSKNSSTLLTQSSQSSQENKSLLEGRCWLELRQRLELGDRNGNSPLEIMDIAWIRRKAKRCRSSFKIKIPFLAAVLQESPELMNGRNGRVKPPCVKLLDPSGSILAAVDSTFVAKYAPELNPGTCLALQNFGLLLFKRELYLTLTARNVIFMTSDFNTGEEEEDYGVKTTTVSDFFPEKIIENYKMLDRLIAIAEQDDEDEDEDDDGQTHSRTGRNSEKLFSIVTYMKTPSNHKGNNSNYFPPDRSEISKGSSQGSTASIQQDVFDDDEEEFFKALGEEFLF